MAKDTDFDPAVADESAATEEPLRVSLDRLAAAERELDAAEVARKARLAEVQSAAEELYSTIDLTIESLGSERDRLQEQIRGIEERISELQEMRSRSSLDLLAGERLAGPETSEPWSGQDDENGPEPTGQVEGESSDASDDGSLAYESNWYETLKQRHSVDPESEEIDPESEE
jgi:hypothetical protein